ILGLADEGLVRPLHTPGEIAAVVELVALGLVAEGPGQGPHGLVREVVPGESIGRHGGSSRGRQAVEGTVVSDLIESRNPAGNSAFLEGIVNAPARSPRARPAGARIRARAR